MQGKTKRPRPLTVVKRFCDFYTKSGRDFQPCDKPAAWVCLYDGRMTFTRHYRCEDHKPESYEFIAVLPLMGGETFEP